MLNNLLAIVPGTGDKAGNYYIDNIPEALIYALIGFGVVFVGIVLIIFVIWLVGVVMRKFEAKPNAEKTVVEVKEPPVSAVPTVQTSDEISDEVKVAIMAAIMAYYQEQELKCEFTVKRIRRI